MSGRWYAKVPENLTAQKIIEWKPRKVGEFTTKKDQSEEYITFRELLAEKLELSSLISGLSKTHPVIAFLEDE